MLFSYIKYSLILVCFAAGIQYSVFAQKQKPVPFRIILSSSMFQNAKPEDVEAATRILANELNKESTNLPDYQIEVCNNSSELQANLKTDFDLLYISPIEYLQLKKKFSIEPALVTETRNSFGDVYYLITNKSDNINELKDLKNKNINILSNNEEQSATLWLEKILRDNNLPNRNSFFKKIVYDNKPTNIVLPVYFKKTNAAIITSASYDLLSELNPQIKNQIQILVISKPFIRAIFCFDGRNKDEKRKKFLNDYMSQIHKGTYGRQITELYMVDKLIAFKKEYLDNILDLYK